MTMGRIAVELNNRRIGAYERNGKTPGKFTSFAEGTML